MRSERVAAPADPAGDDDHARDGVPVALLDADALGDALVVRCWQAGDRIAPAGMQGSKTLSDLFVDRRVPRADRATLPLVLAGPALAWVAGLAIDRRFAPTADTRGWVVLRARRLGAQPAPDDQAVAGVGRRRPPRLTRRTPLPWSICWSAATAPGAARASRG